MKRVLSILFAALIMTMCVMPLAVSAETTEEQYIYFDVPSGAVSWNNFSMVYCHMWSKTGGDVYAWQAKEETCEDMGHGYWRYDLSGINFDLEGEYSLIFSNENGMQTYNLNITSACRGDLVYCDGTTVANPVDGEKQCAVARWTNNGEKVHPAIEVDSAGKTVNIDEVSEDDIETVWGDSEGTVFELPEKENTEETVIEDADDDSITIAADPDAQAEKEDGINLKAATTWIIIASAGCVLLIVGLVIFLARKNRK